MGRGKQRQVMELEGFGVVGGMWVGWFKGGGMGVR